VVKGYASHEQEVFENVTNARAQVGKVTISADQLGNEEAFKQFQKAQAEMSSGLSRLLAVAENYPQLKADGAFRDLQAQLEGTENRITVARKRYIDTVRNFNVTVRSFPSNLTAKVFGITTKQNFTVENEEAISKPPAVQF
jgi:LemA protein